MASRKQLQHAACIVSDPRWQDVLQRNSQADGCFVYAVSTTGVYCRPSCPARLPQPQNVHFFEHCDAAEQAGYRACLRCTPRQDSPRQRQMAVIAAACQFIAEADGTPDLQQLADQAGMSRFHFHRLFKTCTGLTPRGYAMAARQQRLQQQLHAATSITSAIYAAGYQSSSHFYAESTQILGMTPSAYRAGGDKAVIRFAIGQCSLGAILVAHSEKGLCAILLDDQPDLLLQQLQDQFPRASLIGADADFEQHVALVIGLIDDPRQGLQLPLDIRGTAFQQRVWQALCDIPPGQTLSYSEVAARIGSPGAVRAVARACAANTLAVAIPCHRVVRQDGQPSGYRWGLERKQALLDKEKA